MENRIKVFHPVLTWFRDRRGGTAAHVFENCLIFVRQKFQKKKLVDLKFQAYILGNFFLI